jgi:hypothetical protein
MNAVGCSSEKNASNAGVKLQLVLCASRWGCQQSGIDRQAAAFRRVESGGERSSLAGRGTGGGLERKRGGGTRG